MATHQTDIVRVTFPLPGRLIDLVFLTAHDLTYHPLLSGRLCSFVASDASFDTYDALAHSFDAPQRSPNSPLPRIARKGPASPPWHLKDIRASRRPPSRSWLQGDARVHPRNRPQRTAGRRKRWCRREHHAGKRWRRRRLYHWSRQSRSQLVARRNAFRG